MMDTNERLQVKAMRDRLKKILPELKLAYENAKELSNKYNWDVNYFDMCEAYMNLADEYIGVIEVLNEESGGGGSK